MTNILVVEDDLNLNKFLCTSLNNHNYKVTGCLSSMDAFDKLTDNYFDLIISDIMMPEVDGFEFAKSVRNTNSQIPIIFITARDDFSAKQKGYNLGIDDYMVKPIDFNELLLRINALLRRANIESSKKIILGNLTLNSETMLATINNQPIKTSIREFNILYKLLSYPNHPFSRNQLMDEFWDIDSETTLRAVDVYITRLREKFSECNEFKIVTMYGLGYKAVVQDE